MVVPGMYLADRYEILEKIGSGGMSDVYKAKDHKLNRLVAVKVLKHEFSIDATFVKKFRVEAQSAAGLSHPNIVNVYDVGEENGIHFIIMELIQGITLKKYIEMKGKLDIKEALNISVQIASGLQAAHDNRIIHRDIKPQNIIMSRDGKVKVTDFGIAKVADSTTVTTNAAGSVHYISPEQARGGYSDAKSDIYSLGITMYEMLTGKVPFEGETNVAVALLHIQGEMVPPRRLDPTIPRSFEKIVLKCTQKKPDRRYLSAREVISDLRKVLTHPDGDYVVLAGVTASSSSVSDQTVVLDEQNLNRVRNGVSSAAMTGAAAGTRNAYANDNGNQNRNSSRNQYPNRNNHKRSEFDDDDGDGDNVNPALEKVMMILGIVGAVILVVVIFFVIGKAAGLFSGKTNKEETKIESQSETVPGETKETETETETETAAMVEVPDLLGMTQDEAASELMKYKLFLSVKTGQSDEYEDGEIYKQDPEKGTKIDPKKLDKITVYVHKTEFATIDSVEGLTQSQAKTTIEAKGLAISDVKYEYHDTIKSDLAIRTDPAAGTSLEKGESVILYMSKGKEEKMISMPQVVGYSLADAKSILQQNNLNTGNVTEEYNDEVAEGKIIRSSVSYGTQVKQGTSIDLVVSKGKENKIYKAFIGIYNDPNGGMADGTTSSIKIVVNKPDGTADTILEGTTTVGQWVPVEENVTSTVAGQGSYEIILDGASLGKVSVEFK